MYNSWKVLLYSMHVNQLQNEHENDKCFCHKNILAWNTITNGKTNTSHWIYSQNDQKMGQQCQKSFIRGNVLHEPCSYVQQICEKTNMILHVIHYVTAKLSHLTKVSIIKKRTIIWTDRKNFSALNRQAFGSHCFNFRALKYIGDGEKRWLRMDT